MSSGLLVFFFVLLIGYNLSKHGYLYAALIFGWIACSPIILVHKDLVPSEGYKISAAETSDPYRLLTTVEIAGSLVSILFLSGSYIVSYSSNMMLIDAIEIPSAGHLYPSQRRAEKTDETLLKTVDII